MTDVGRAEVGSAVACVELWPGLWSLPHARVPVLPHPAVCALGNGLLLL